MAISKIRTVVRVGLFTELGESGMLGLSDCVGFTREEFEKARSSLLFRVGEERGIVGLAAESGQPIYVADCHADERWQGHTDQIRSAYFVPRKDAEGHPRVIVLLSPSIDGIDPAQRGLADLLIGFLGCSGGCCGVGERARRLEQGLHTIFGLLEDIGVSRTERPARRSDEVLRLIQALSPREHEVLRRLSRGDRVATISRELGISPNTVRNHLKAIFRKLGVRSQAELLELVRPKTDDR